MTHQPNFKPLQKQIKSVFDLWFLYAFLVIFSLKLAYLLINGYSVEVDSYGYFDCVLHFEYPPVYPYFLYLLKAIYPNLFFIAFVQAVLFSLSSAFLLRYLSKTPEHAGTTERRWLFIAAIVIGLEPVTSFFCSNMMSECLFLTLLFPWLITIHSFFREESNSRSKILLIGVLSGILYSVRFAGLLFAVFFLLFLLLDKFKRKTFFFSFLLFFIGFQAAILPIRIKYKVLFDTYQINGFTGGVLWNNASTVYLSSTIHKNPQTDFEKYLALSNTIFFSQNGKALKGRQLWEANFPYRKYIAEKGYQFQDYPKISGEAMNTAIRIVMEHPYLYLKNYVIPNFLQVFLEDEYVDISAYRNYYQSNFAAASLKSVTYSRYYSLFYVALLIVCTAIYLLRKNRSLLCKILLPFSWLYILVLPFISILAIRLYLILVPFILLIFLLQIPWREKTNTE